MFLPLSVIRYRLSQCVTFGRQLSMAERRGEGAEPLVFS